MGGRRCDQQKIRVCLCEKGGTDTRPISPGRVNKYINLLPSVRYADSSCFRFFFFFTVYYRLQTMRTKAREMENLRVSEWMRDRINSIKILFVECTCFGITMSTVGQNYISLSLRPTITCAFQKSRFLASDNLSQSDFADENVEVLVNSLMYSINVVMSRHAVSFHIAVMNISFIMLHSS